MFGNLAEMAGLVKKAKDIQNNMKTAKEELAELEVTGFSPGDQVQAVVSCDMQVKKLTIAPDATANVELLEDLVVLAVNDALNNARKQVQEKMSAITGGIDLSALM